jgi:hypothetical protein
LQRRLARITLIHTSPAAVRQLQVSKSGSKREFIGCLSFGHE